MKVDIQREEIREGLIFKKTHYQVSVEVTFSDEEKEIIKSRDLNRTVVMKRPTPSNRSPSANDEYIYSIEISSLMSKGPLHHASATPAEAARYEEELKESLKQLKVYLDENSGPTEGSESFEL